MHGLGAKLELFALWGVIIGMGWMAVEVDEERDEGIHVGFVTLSHPVSMIWLR